MEQRIGARRPAGELGVELHPDEERMVGQLGNLVDRLIRLPPGEHHAAIFEHALVEGVELVAVAEPLVRRQPPVQARHQRPGAQLYLFAAEPHRAADPFDLVLLRQQAHDRVGGSGVVLGAVGVRHVAAGAGVLHHRRLESVADAQHRQPVGARMGDAGDLAFPAARPEPARHDDAVHRGQMPRGARLPFHAAAGQFDGVGGDVHHLHPHAAGAAGVLQCAVDAGVGVARPHVLAGQPYHHPFGGAGEPAEVLGEVEPCSPGLGLHAEVSQGQIVDILRRQVVRHLVHRLLTVQIDHVAFRQAQPLGQLAQHAGLHRILAPAHQHVRLDAHLHQHLRAVLGGLAFLLVQVRGLDDPRQVDEQDVVLALLVGEFAHRRDVRPHLLVADRAADLHQGDVRLVGQRRLAHEADHLAGHMRKELHVGAGELAAAFQLVQAPGQPPVGEDVVLREALVDEPFIGADVHVALGAVVEHEYLAVAERAQGAGVLVEVAVHLDEVGAPAVLLQQRRQAGGEHPLAETADHAAGDDDELGLTGLIAGRQEGIFLARVGTAAEGAQAVGNRVGNLRHAASACRMCLSLLP